uniref:Uncharacterized protein n=1 Tax=Lepeophtheirus salmonis TaxID=72036 RepID=A0A0K2V9U9_LEPSM
MLPLSRPRFKASREVLRRNISVNHPEVLDIIFKKI